MRTLFIIGFAGLLFLVTQHFSKSRHTFHRGYVIQKTVVVSPDEYILMGGKIRRVVFPKQYRLICMNKTHSRVEVFAVSRTIFEQSVVSDSHLRNFFDMSEIGDTDP